MPNHITNIVSCPKHVIEEMLNHDKDVATFDFNKVLPQPEFDENEPGPMPAWYTWRCENWGTKWNSYEFKRLYDNIVSFETAWSTPEPVFLAISEKFDCVVEVRYADEDIGSNCGQMIFDRGDKVEHWFPRENGSEKFARSVLGLNVDWDFIEAKINRQFKHA